MLCTLRLFQFCENTIVFQGWIIPTIEQAILQGILKTSFIFLFNQTSLGCEKRNHFALRLILSRKIFALLSKLRRSTQICYKTFK